MISVVAAQPTVLTIQFHQYHQCRPLLVGQSVLDMDLFAKAGRIGFIDTSANFQRRKRVGPKSARSAADMYQKLVGGFKSVSFVFETYNLDDFPNDFSSFWEWLETTRIIAKSLSTGVFDGV